jgi:hypothetical protein
LLQKTIKDVSAHITVDCELCKAKGYLCEVGDRSSGVAQHALPQPPTGFGSSVLICAGVPKPAAHLSVPRLGAPVSARAPTTARIRCAIASHRIASHAARPRPHAVWGTVRRGIRWLIVRATVLGGNCSSLFHASCWKPDCQCPKSDLVWYPRTLLHASEFMRGNNAA